MKTPILKAIFLTFAVLTLMAITNSTVLAKSSARLPSVDINDNFINVEDLGADFHRASGTITVTAKIKNVSHSIIKGYATIYLLAPSGQELYTYQEEVNGGDGFTHGSTINFEASTQVPDINKVGSISVDFTRK